MLGHVGQRFLDDAVERRLGGRRQPLARRSLDGDLEPRAFRGAVGQELERRAQAEVVQDRRPELVREVAQLLLDLVQEPAHVLQPPRGRGRQVAGDVGEADVDGGE